ncbi:MAG: dodecin domain-containing protein [Xanthomonadales bacterium]|nr:dodecin domain-containing protein [Xanthomonadales bacterium]
MADWPAVTWQLPDWITGFVQGWQGALETPGQRMELVIELARENVRRGTGGPFAAVVFDANGQVVAPGVNLVTAINSSAAHAEVVALTLAQAVVGSFDLSTGDYELVTSTEPCAMCLGAIPWSGVRSLVCGSTAADAEAIGFDEGSKPEDWKGTLRARGMTVLTEVSRKRSTSVFADYARSGGVIYNPQSQGSTAATDRGDQEIPATGGKNMAVARVTEIIASSPKSFEAAINKGVKRATKTLKGVRGAWVDGQKVIIKNGQIVEYRVNLKVTFVLKD